jgi:hypothetical protein
MEDRFRIPGTDIRFGLDAIFGLFLPGVGDVATMFVGLPILFAAIRRRHPWRVLLMMALNLLLDSTLGSIPIAGDVFDILWKAQKKNLELLENPASLGGIWEQAKGRLIALSAAVIALAIGGFVILWLVVRWVEGMLAG